MECGYVTWKPAIGFLWVWRSRQQVTQNIITALRRISCSGEMKLSIVNETKQKIIMPLGAYFGKRKCANKNKWVEDHGWDLIAPGESSREKHRQTRVEELPLEWTGAKGIKLRDYKINNVDCVLKYHLLDVNDNEMWFATCVQSRYTIPRFFLIYHTM